MLTSLNDYLQVLQNGSSSDNIPNYEVSPIVEEIIAAQQLEAKVMDMKHLAEELLNDLHGYEEFKQKVSGFLKEIKQQHSDLFDSWTAEITAQIENNKLRYMKQI